MCTQMNRYILQLVLCGGGGCGLHIVCGGSGCTYMEVMVLYVWQWWCYCMYVCMVVYKMQRIHKQSKFFSQ